MTDERIIANLKRTNSHLWSELLRLDELSPVAGVVLSRKFAHSILNTLVRSTQAVGLARKLRRAIEKYEASLGEVAERLLDNA